MSQETLWFSPADYRLATPDLAFVDTPGPSAVGIAVRSSRTGDKQWIILPLAVPPNAALAQLRLCYGVSDKRTSIARIRIAGLAEPAKPIVLFEDATPLDRTTPECRTFDLRKGGKPVPATPALTLELELNFGGAHTVALGGVSCGIVVSGCRNEHLVSEYYDATPEAAEALEKGVTSILGEDGGFLCTPADGVTAGFVPRNLAGHEVLDANRTSFESVTVIDARNGVERRYLPPVGDDNSELTTYAGQILERDLAVDLGWQGAYAVESLCSRMTGGGSSVSMRLKEKTPMGSRRFYVPSLLGFFPGQKLLIGLITSMLFTVARLGEDATGPYIETEEAAPRAIVETESIYNKNNVGVLTLSDTSNADNQGVSLTVQRRAYGAGDLFLFGGLLDYQSGIFSGLGDEGAVGCAVDLLHDIEAFRGEVENAAPPAMGRQETLLTYKPTAKAPSTLHSQKLGTSRPLVNLAKTKWKYDGVANVIYANPTGWLMPALPAPDPTPYAYDGCVLIRAKDAMTDWAKLAGSFLTFLGRAGASDRLEDNDASEYYKAKEATPRGALSADVHRWWHITHIQDLGGGRAYVFVDRTVRRAHDVVKSAPQLFRAINVTDGEAQIDLHALRYVIAPGAWVADVRNGVAGNVLGNEGAPELHPRQILLAPGRPRLEPGDPITNAPGGDVRHPSGFRVRHVHHFPASAGTADSFVSENLGRVQVGSGLHIAGLVAPEKGETMPDALQRLQKDQRPLYIDGIRVSAPTDTAIRLDGYTERGAIELFQQWSDQDVVWWSPNYSDRSILGRHRDDGHFLFTTFAGGKTPPATLTGPNGITLTRVNGLSATATAAKNLSGRGEVKKLTKTATITFPKDHDEVDENYRVFVQCSWMTASVISKREKTFFEVTVDVAPPEDAPFDWLIVR